jgi:hypothetical protein
MRNAYSTLLTVKYLKVKERFGTLATDGRIILTLISHALWLTCITVAYL